MSTRNTSAPCLASSVAVARPLPQPGPTDPAPVTIATFPFMLSTQHPPAQRREDDSQGGGRPGGEVRGKRCGETSVTCGVSLGDTSTRQLWEAGAAPRAGS